MANAASRLPVEPWLITTAANGEPKYNLAYSANTGLAPRKSFTTPASYLYHFGAALVYDRDERNRPQSRQYSYAVQYPARIQDIGDQRFMIDVKLSGDSLVHGGTKLIPQGGIELTVSVLVQADIDDHRFTGKVTGSVAAGYDFQVLTPLPSRMNKAALGLDEATSSAMFQVNVIWTPGLDNFFSRA